MAATSEHQVSITTPVQLYGWNGGPVRIGADEVVILDDAGAPSATYIGKAPPGTATSEAKWKICKLNESSGLSLTWADGGNYTQVFDDRASLTYA